MALVVLGESECPICHKTLSEDSDIISFSAFVANPSDPLVFFNDGAFHRECFYKHPLATRAEKRYNELREKNKPSNRICEVCRKLIASPSDYFSFGLLTDDENNPLYEYNYKHFHYSHLNKWSALSKFKILLNEQGPSNKFINSDLYAALETVEKGN